MLKPDQVRNHPNLHVIRRYLGSSKAPQVDVRMRLAKDETDTQSRSHQGLQLHPGDVLLLCTDGLTDILADSEIRATVRSHAASGQGLHSAARSLVEQAVARGGTDNITAVLLSVPVAGSPKNKKGFLPRLLAG
jgi:serine/threonine protein phosphatase PrpC